MSVLLNDGCKKKINRGFVIVGTDTGVGKTLVAASISLNLIERGERVAILKPIASGSYIRNDQLVNDDALILRECSSSRQELYSKINPFVFEDPIAPHLAAQKCKVDLSVSRVIEKSQAVLTSDADCVIIEGAGGWLTPLNDRETIADLAIAYGYPVILVVGIRLGVLNYAFLTNYHMYRSGTRMAGWVANIVDPDISCVKENILTIKNKIHARFLG